MSKSATYFPGNKQPDHPAHRKDGGRIPVLRAVKAHPAGPPPRRGCAPGAKSIPARRTMSPAGTAPASRPRSGRHPRIRIVPEKPCGRGRTATATLPKRTPGVQGRGAGRGPGPTACAKSATPAKAPPSPPLPFPPPDAKRPGSLRSPARMVSGDGLRCPGGAVAPAGAGVRRPWRPRAPPESWPPDGGPDPGPGPGPGPRGCRSPHGP